MSHSISVTLYIPLTEDQDFLSKLPPATILLGAEEFYTLFQKPSRRSTEYYRVYCAYSLACQLRNLTPFTHHENPPPEWTENT